MSYVLVRAEDGKYVARPGARSYTKALEGAQVFATREQAEAERCGNEMIRSVSELLSPTR